MINYARVKDSSEFESTLTIIDAINDITSDLRGLGRLYLDAIATTDSPNIDGSTVRLTVNLLEMAADALDAVADSDVMRGDGATVRP